MSLFQMLFKKFISSSFNFKQMVQIMYQLRQEYVQLIRNCYFVVKYLIQEWKIQINYLI